MASTSWENCSSGKMKEYSIWGEKNWSEFYCPSGDKVLSTAWLRRKDFVSKKQISHSWDVSLESSRVCFKCVMQSINFTEFNSSKQLSDKETQHQPTHYLSENKLGIRDKVQGLITCQTERKYMKHCPFTIQGAELFWSWELQKFKSDVSPGQRCSKSLNSIYILKLLDS